MLEKTGDHFPSNPPSVFSLLLNTHCFCKKAFIAKKYSVAQDTKKVQYWISGSTVLSQDLSSFQVYIAVFHFLLLSLFKAL